MCSNNNTSFNDKDCTSLLVSKPEVIKSTHDAFGLVFWVFNLDFRFLKDNFFVLSVYSMLLHMAFCLVPSLEIHSAFHQRFDVVDLTV